MSESQFMSVVIPVATLAVAFGAFCIWLTVRIINRRERWAKWTAVAILVIGPVLYVLSSGPMKMVGWRSQKNPPAGIPFPMPATVSVSHSCRISDKAWLSSFEQRLCFFDP
jgi:hypothetical protein